VCVFMWVYMHVRVCVYVYMHNTVPYNNNRFTALYQGQPR